MPEAKMKNTEMINWVQSPVQRQLVDFYGVVAAAVSCEVVVQDAPGVTGRRDPRACTPCSAGRSCRTSRGASGPRRNH
jgi:hypothetical protein